MHSQFHILISLGSFIFIAGMTTLYFFGLNAVVRVTRQPKPPGLHPTRATMAAVIVLLGFGFLLIMFVIDATSSAAFSQARFQSRVSRELAFSMANEETNQQHAELEKAITGVKKNLEEKMKEIAVGVEKQNIYNQTATFIANSLRKQNQIAQEEWKRLLHNDVSSGGFARISAGSVVFPAIFFVLPGTIMGIGYVARIRKEKERPGLVSGLFAALTWPILLILGTTTTLILVFGLVGFLIALTVIAILAGVYFLVRYWLSH